MLIVTVNLTPNEIFVYLPYSPYVRVLIEMTSLLTRSRLIASSDSDRMRSLSSLLPESKDDGDKLSEYYFPDKVYLTASYHHHDHYAIENMEAIDKEKTSGLTWRLKDRMKTSGVALVVCLNIGTDPPDVIKPVPCARKECWFDPKGSNQQKGLEYIGRALQQQYEKLQSKVKYRQCLDPTSEELRKVCLALRRGSTNDRLLFHYNGHGVPKPTKNGELWVFGKHYTHYTPVAIYELKNWLGDPSIYVLDCSAAGMLIPHLVDTLNSKPEEEEGLSAMQRIDIRQRHQPTNTIVLAACKANENIPFHPSYPADVFTSCLTTPIAIAIRWFILQVCTFYSSSLCCH